MDHPNAIYFLLFADAVFLLMTSFVLLGAMNKGPFKTVKIIPNWVLLIIGAVGLVLALSSIYTNLGSWFSR